MNPNPYRARGKPRHRYIGGNPSRLFDWKMPSCSSQSNHESSHCLLACLPDRVRNVTAGHRVRFRLMAHGRL